MKYRIFWKTLKNIQIQGATREAPQRSTPREDAERGRNAGDECFSEFSLKDKVS